VNNIVSNLPKELFFKEMINACGAGNVAYPS
jgi:hypothetical protein